MAALLTPQQQNYSRRPFGRLTRCAAAAAAILCISTPSALGAPPPKDKTLTELQRKREDLRQTKAAAASKLDTLKATDTEIAAALEDLSNNISGQASLLEDARRAVADADAEQAAAAAAEAAAVEELGQLNLSLKEQAIRAYTSSAQDASLDIFSAQSLSDASTKQQLLELSANSGLDSAERFRTVQEDLGLARERSAEAAKRATAKREQVASRLAKLESAQDQQEKFAQTVDERIEAGLAEAQSLAELDTALSSEINNRQAQLAAQLEAQRKAAQKRASSAGGRPASPRNTNTNVPTLPTSGGNGIVKVRGIGVDQSIAGQLEKMLAAAEAAGITMGGGGYRDPAGQIAVRRSNCGSSNYAIYEMPASSCRPPTARPGRSMHEQGLAIDFTQGGGTLNRGSSAYQWLKANAAGYGFYNLPSEPWHWSTNGN